MQPWKDLVEGSVNYYEIGDYIFVHGWIPCLGEGLTPAHRSNELKYVSRWRQLPKDSYLWDEAVWLNGGKCWAQDCREDGKTIVCGHYHCTWGHSEIHQDREEYPDKTQKDNFKHIFER